MFRDRLQLGPEEKQVIDGLAFLARTVNGVRMEMDLFVENVHNKILPFGDFSSAIDMLLCIGA